MFTLWERRKYVAFTADIVNQNQASTKTSPMANIDNEGRDAMRTKCFEYAGQIRHWLRT